VHLLIRQYAAFNSPVWFNVGCDRIEPNSDGRNWHWNAALGRVEFGVTGYTRPQCSACFINSVHDSLDSILTLAKTEGMLFKWGSGTGTNLSPLRSSTESLSGGGTASGPLSFMKGFDAFDDFMYAVTRDTDFSTRAIKDDAWSTPTTPKICCAKFLKPPGSAAIPACSSIPRSTAGTLRRTPRASTLRIPAPSTCSSTTRLV